jgi:hypothetical protein
MNPYRDKTYGRNAEVADLYRMFGSGRNVSMHGPRRLGKTFVLDRLVDAAAEQGWTAIKVELAGCSDTRAVFRELCAGIGTRRSGGAAAISWFAQRISQILAPRVDASSAWYQPLLTLDHESQFERLIGAMDDDRKRRWLLLIDELPIFLKSLHDQGPGGVTAARNFMNQNSRLREKYSKVRWMITGSIGIAPLAQAGDYQGVLAKFDNFELHPLSEAQARDYVQDIAAGGQLLHRKDITDAEAQAIIEAVGWRAAYYLEALAQKLKGQPMSATDDAKRAVEAAVAELLEPAEMPRFGPWEEHLRKHYRDTDQMVAFSVMAALARAAQGQDIDGLLTEIQRSGLTRDQLRQLLTRLHVEGFITVDDWDQDSPRCSFRNPLLRRWWLRYKPQSRV